MTDKQKIALLRKLINSCGSQSGAASLLSVSRATVSLWIRGKQRIPDVAVPAIERAVGR